MLLPANRERIVRWVRQPHTHAPPAGNGAQLVFDMIREQRRVTQVRVLRDGGLLVGIALVGAAVAIYVEPPVTLGWAASSLRGVPRSWC